MRLLSHFSFLLESMAVQPQQQRDHRAARKQQLNGQIRAGVARELNQCVHCVTFSHLGAPEIRCHLVEGMLLAVRISLISDHDRFVARLFRIHVNPQGCLAGELVHTLGYELPIAYHHPRWRRDAAPLLDHLGCVIDHEVAYSRGGPTRLKISR